MSIGFFDKTIASSIGMIPKPIIRRVASRYVAGETLDDAIAEARRLNEQGYLVTVDLLGEAIATAREADAITRTYTEILDAIAEHGIDGNISVKPTAVGLASSPEDLERNALALVRHAARTDNFVRIDMEDSPTTDDTIAVVRRIREAGHDNIGWVFQASLRRTPQDLEDLRALGPNLRLCKGVYLEPEELAWQGYDEVNRAFGALLAELLPRRDHYLGIATHDDPVVEGAEALIREHGLTRDQYEFQVLLGVRPELRERLRDNGHRVRVYVPYGAAWHAYCVRRLKENPRFAGFVTKDVLRNPSMLLGDQSKR
jgi:proline dehydrogenase